MIWLQLMPGTLVRVVALQEPGWVWGHTEGMMTDGPWPWPLPAALGYGLIKVWRGRTSVLLHMDLATSMLSHSRWAVPSTYPLGLFASASELSL